MRNYRYQFLKYVRNYRYHLKKHTKLWVSFWENIVKLLGFTDEIHVILKFWVKDMQQLFDDYFVLQKSYLLCGIMGIVFIMFAELWVTSFQTCAELLVQYFNQNGTSSSKIRLTN